MMNAFLAVRKMDILDALKDNWEVLVASFGLGGGGSAAAKKLLDSQQNKRLDVIEKELPTLKEGQKQLAERIDANTQMDRERYNNIEKNLDRIHTMLDNLTQHLLTNK